MDFRVIVSPSARKDLKELVQYIARDNPGAAEKMGMKILKDINRISEFPEMGRMVPEFQNPDLKEIIVYPFRVIYRVNRGSGYPEVVRIWKGSKGDPRI